MMLKDKDGNVVYGKYALDSCTFHVIRGTELEQVQEAIICEGKPESLPMPFVSRLFLEKTGLSPSYILNRDGYMWVDKRDDDAAHFINEMNEYSYLTKPHGYYYFDGKGSLAPKYVLELIGEGKTVTVDSFKKACAKNETRPRLLLGDKVNIIGTGNFQGIIVSLGSKVNVRRTDGKTYPVEYRRVVRTNKLSFDGFISTLDESLTAGFDSLAASKHRVYKSKIIIRDVTIPIFPDPVRKSVKHERTESCDCPTCGWAMGENGDSVGFLFWECCFCNQLGIVISKTETEIALLMLKQPSKCQVNIKESRCCSNCALFAFEGSSVKKRSTGYCTITNQVVQAYNTCSSEKGEGYWFPRPPEKYNR